MITADHLRKVTTSSTVNKGRWRKFTFCGSGLASAVVVP